MKKLPAKISRHLVAEEAARLLCYGLVEEYKEAKEKAAAALGESLLPSNIEIAHEVDKLADEIEGPSRKELLVALRKEALKIMRVLSEFQPRLIGSVWRGTCHKGSDIDIIVFSFEPNVIIDALKHNGYAKFKTEWKSKLENGEMNTFLHIHLFQEPAMDIEVVVNDPSRFGKMEKCEIYGDLKTGLTIPQLRLILEKDPTKDFLP